MLQRKAYAKLQDWKENGKKPLLVYGQRQIGKTYAVKKFAEENFLSYYYADLSRDEKVRSAFSNGNVDDIILSINTISNDSKIEPGDLIVLDEIQDCDHALSSLKLFALDGRYKVIASGSMLGVRLGSSNENTALSPMGYTEPFRMQSLDFEEFLWSQNIPQESVEKVRECVKNGREIIDTLYLAFSELFRIYMIVGGMPAAVEAFNADRTTFKAASAEMESILLQINRDINRYNRGTEAAKTMECFESIPSQLSQTNKRFHYSRIRNMQSRKAADRFMENLLWIKDAGYGNYVHAVNQIASPLAAQKKPDAFRIYFSDTGLLTHMYGETAVSAVFTSDTSYNLGAITENAVAEALAKCGYSPYYYKKTGGDGRMEIDFVIESFNGISAIEVKSGKDRDAPSIGKVGDVFDVSKKIVFENSNIFTDGDVVHMPLFASAFMDSLDEKPEFMI